MSSISAMMKNISLEQSDDQRSYEVKKVTSARMVDGKFEFKLKYKGYTEEFWTADKDCDCEELIHDCLARMGIKAVYCICRVSTKKQQGPTHLSLDMQSAKLTRMARERYPNARIKVIRISESAYKGIPKKLADLADIVGQGDVLLFHSVDRVSRNIVKFLGTLEELNNRGVSVHAMVENLWYHEHKLDFIQFIVNANREAETMARRVRQAIQARRERGDDFGCSYGYKLVREEKTNRLYRVEHPDEQKTIAHIGELHDKGDSIQRIVTVLNKTCKKRGKVWTKTSVMSIIRNLKKW